MRSSIMLLLRALLIMGSILAVMACKSPLYAAGVTGGRGLEPLIQPAANVEVRNNTTFGVITFTLNEDSYSWQFVPAAGGTFTDSGTGTCH